MKPIALTGALAVLILSGCGLGLFPLGHNGSPSLAQLSISDGTAGSTHSFGAQTSGTTSDHSFTVTNSGSGSAASLSGLAGMTTAQFIFKGGSYPGVGGTCGLALSAGQACTVTLSFFPRIGGNFTDGLRLDYFDGGANAFAQFGLSGSANGGAVDSAFGSAGGFAIVDNAGFDDELWDLAVQPDGKIVLVGTSDNGSDLNFMVARLLSNGTLDTTFGVGGIALTTIGGLNDVAESVALQTDGGILVVGYSRNAIGNDDFAVARYLTSGVLDTAFGAAGVVTGPISATGHDQIHSISVLSDGRFVVGGESVTGGGDSDVALARYLSNGQLDTSFGGTGVVVTPVFTVDDDRLYGVAIQPDGKIVGVGNTIDSGSSNFLVTRHLANGNLDSSFASNGVFRLDLGIEESFSQVILQGDGKLLIVGQISLGGGNVDVVVYRFSSDGAIDSTFATNGRAQFDWTGAINTGQRIFQHSDGRLSVAGESDAGIFDFGLARLESGGALDTTFSSDGKMVISVPGVPALSYHSRAAGTQNGQVILAGTGSTSDWNFYVTRVWP